MYSGKTIMSMRINSVLQIAINKAFQHDLPNCTSCLPWKNVVFTISHGRKKIFLHT